MRNIDKIKEMNAKELAHLIHSNRCKVCEICAFHNSNGNCEGNCEDGIERWLNKKADITQDDIDREFNVHCINYCENIGDCPYEYSAECKIIWFMENFNINDGKITRRK